MVKSITEFMKRILIVTMLFIMVTFFAIDPYVRAASQLPAEGEFYYAGTTKGTYTVTENIFEWLLNNLGQIVDWILGLLTMAFRMSFVGWGTIFEWMLTSTLESTTGATYLDEALDATNVTSANDSSQNVTVEAIVYNNVPLFDINFFNFEVDKNRTGTGRDLTKLICEKCEKKYDAENTGPDICSCTEKECKCVACKTRRIMQVAATDPDYKSVVTLIKETVAEWFYVMRYIAVAAMLLILVAIGIKIAISTLASEKAVYKRMLMDWFVGMIFLFFIEYIMLFFINLNDVMVTTIEDYAKSEESIAAQVTKVEFGDDEKTNRDLEIGVYDAARTRAYDPKLINGTTGMILYLTLVVFAWRFSWMYLKRYFTLIILTLMGPAVAFAYAIQKVFTGKAKSWSTWFNEYIVNIFIQTVHAIIYSSCVSTALVISLDSIAGMIVAFILMNFMLKADKIFRKIFKMSSDGSLLDRVSKGAEEAKLDKIAKAATGAVAGAKPMVDAMSKTPMGAALRGVTKGAVGGMVANIAQSRHEAKMEEQKRLAEQVESDFRETVGEDEYKRMTAEGADKTEYNAAKKAYMDALTEVDDDLRDFTMAGDPDNKDAYAQKLAQAEHDTLARAMQAKANGEDASELFAEYRNLNARRRNFEKYAARSEASQSALDRLFDYNKYFDENGNRRETFSFNPITGKVETKGTAEMFGESLNLGYLYDMSDKEVEQLKSTLKAGAARLTAPMIMFAGLGTVVASPGVGLGLMAYSVNSGVKASKKSRNVRKPQHRSRYQNRKYDNLQFTGGAVENMADLVLDRYTEQVDAWGTAEEREAVRKAYDIPVREDVAEHVETAELTEKQARVTDIVDRMYANGSALDTRGGMTKFADAVLDNSMGGMSEELDTLAEMQNKAALQRMAEFKTESDTVAVKCEEFNIYRKMSELDKLNAERAQREDSRDTLIEDDKERVVMQVTSQMDSMVTQAVKELKIEPSETGKLTKEQRQAVSDKVRDIAKQKGVDLAVLLKKPTDAGTTVGNEDLTIRIDQAVEARVGGAVARIKLDQEKVEKRKNIKLDNVETAAQEYQITEEEKVAIADEVKKQIKDKGIKSLDDLKSNKESIIKEYQAKSGLSEEEAAVQVEVFMNQLQTTQSKKSDGAIQIKDTIKQHAEDGAVKKLADKKSGQDRNKLLEELSIVREEPSENDADADLIRKQNEILRGLFDSMATMYKINDNAHKTYGKSSGSITDYKQYVKISGSDNYKNVKSAVKKKKTLEMPFGDDPAMHGPILGLEAVLRKI